MEVVGDAASPADYAAAGVDADVLVLAEGGPMISALHNFLPEQGRTSVVALSDNYADAAALAALPIYGWALLPTDTGPEEMRAAIQAAAEGLVAGPPDLFAPILRRGGEALPTAYGIGGTPDAPAGFDSLTERESQVLQLLAHGLPNKQIALALNISEHTVKFHISSIYGKLGVTNRTEAVRAGIQLGLVTL